MIGQCFGSLAHMDFSDLEECRRILMEDKHTRLEGMCIEKFFVQHYLSFAQPEHLSFGWWFSKRTYNSPYYTIKVLHENKLSPADIKVTRHFQKVDVEVEFLFYDSGFNFFTTKLGAMDDISAEELVSKSKRHQHGQLKSLPPEVKDEQRQKQAIEFLENSALLRESAIERFFANRVAGFKGLWDVDAFRVDKNGGLVAYEVKQKFPAKNGSFGLNKGTTDFLKFLVKTGLKVKHVILKKPVDDKDIPALDFIQKSEYKGKNEWLVAEVSDELILNAERIKRSPKETSIHGRYELAYVDLAMDKFKSKGFV